MGKLGGAGKGAWSEGPLLARPDEGGGGESLSGQGCRSRFGPPRWAKESGEPGVETRFPHNEKPLGFLFELPSFLEGARSLCWTLLPQP